MKVGRVIGGGIFADHFFIHMSWIVRIYDTLFLQTLVFALLVTEVSEKMC